MKKYIFIAIIALASTAVLFNLQLFEHIPQWVGASDFSLKVSAGPNNPAGGEIVKGTKGLTMLEVELKSEGSDGLIVSTLCLKVQKDGTNWAYGDELDNFKIYDGERRLAKMNAMGILEDGINLKDGKIFFEDLGIYIPQGGSKILTIRGDLSENIDIDKFRVIMDYHCLNMSDITGQKSNDRPKISGTLDGKYFEVTDNFIHVYEPWHGQNWQVGQQYTIGFNYRYLVDRIKLDLIGYQEMDQLSSSKVFPIVYSYGVDRKLNFDTYNYRVKDDLNYYLDQYKYFKVRATFKIPSGSDLASYESFSSGFFTIGEESIAPSTERLIRADYKVYQIVAGKKLWIPSIEAFNGLGLNWSDIENVSQSELDSFEEIRLVRANSKVYYITNAGQKRHILNERVFESYNNRWNDVVNISDDLLNIYEDNILIRYDGRSEVYVLDNATKRWIKHASTFESLGYDWHKVAVVNKIEFNYYQTGDIIY